MNFSVGLWLASPPRDTPEVVGFPTGLAIVQVKLADPVLAYVVARLDR